MGERTPHTSPSALHEPLAAELMTPRKSIAAGNIEIGRERLLDSKQLKIIDYWHSLRAVAADL